MSLVGELLQVRVIELKLQLEGPIGQAAPLAQQRDLWFVSYHGGFLPDNVAQIPPKPL